MAQAVANFELGTEICIPQGFGTLEECSAPLTLKIDINGSSDPDNDLGGHITDFKITIDGTVYEGAFNSSSPVFSLDNGDVNYTKTKSGTGDFSYSVKA